ncbi:MAG: transporter [Armatimonadota bacterium]
MNSLTTSILFCSLSSLALIPCQAQEADDPISPERPGFTNGTDTVPLARFQFETGYQYARDGKTSEHEIDNSAQLRYGISSRAEIRLGVPAYDWFSSGDGMPGTRGLADSSFSAKWRFLDGMEAKRPSLALILGTTLPTGSKQLGDSHLQPQAALESHFDFADKYSLEANFVYSDARSEGKRFDQYSGGLNLGYNASQTLGMFVETYRISPTEYGGVTGTYVDGGLTYLLGKDTQVDLNGGTGVTRGVRSGFFVGAGIAHRFK